MNAGFSNLATLKAQLLAAALRSATDFDDLIAALGLGVAEAFGNFCNRKFYRLVGDTEILPADKCQFILSRFPIEAVTAIDLKSTEAGGWVSQVVNDLVTTIDTKAGIVNCPDGADLGRWDAQVRFTYTGGYWWPVLDAGDTGYPDTLPTGATSLPSDLKLAWLLQCKHIWQTYDPLGEKLATTENTRHVAQETFAELELIPQVKQMLGQYVRMNLV